jgi:hypothetical protein
MSKWWQESLHALGHSDPDALVALVESGTLDNVELTFAAESLGQVKTPRSTALLGRLLDHEDAVVREGALYGLSAHELSEWLYLKIARMVTNDPSPAIREVAKDCLDRE